MSTSVMTGLLNKATNGNELLSILDAIVYNNSDAEIVEHDTAISVITPTLEPLQFWLLRVLTVCDAVPWQCWGTVLYLFGSLISLSVSYPAWLSGVYKEGGGFEKSKLP